MLLFRTPSHPNSAGIPDAMNCKIELRKYVLTRKSSRWAQKGDRVLVHSPMLDISTAEQVPVRRYNGVEENCVCFLPKQDIEKETSKAYRRALISRDTEVVEAHGAALVDSPPGKEFEYCRGDRFWILNPSDADNANISVINLRTFGAGYIPIDDVCWFPRLQGESGETWTIGGLARNLRLAGSKGFLHYSYAIRQMPDGTYTSENVQIPARKEEIPGKRWLTLLDSRSHFARTWALATEKRSPFDQLTWHADEHRQRESAQESRHSSQPRSPIPPLSFLVDSEDDKQTRQEHAPASRPPRKHSEYLPGIFELREQGSKASQMSSRSDILPHPRLPNDPDPDYISAHTSAQNSSLRRLSSATASSFDFSTSSLSSSGRASAATSVYSEPSTYKELSDEHGSASPTISSSEPDEGANSLLRLRAGRAASQSASRVTRWPAIIHGAGPGKLPQIYALQRRASEICESDQAMNMKYCSRRDPKCRYSAMWPFAHHHPLQSKCIGGSHRDGIHCVSRTGPFPGYAGDCLLGDSWRFLGHKCCRWTEEDRKSYPPCHSRKPFDYAKHTKNTTRLVDLGKTLQGDSYQDMFDEELDETDCNVGFQLQESGLTSEELIDSWKEKGKWNDR